METTTRQYRILLVDDLPVNIDILAAALSQYKILVAKGSDKAMGIISGDVKPDLILLDVEMPGMNGYQVCEKIRSDKRYDDIPVIFLTAKTDKDSIVRGFEAGGQDYVTKPFDLKELVARVNTHLELKQSKETLAALNGLLENRVEERTRDLRSALDELEATNKELDTFVYRASHDLKGPTASLLGLVQLGKNYPTDQEDILGRIGDVGINLTKVLDKLILKYRISQVPAEYKVIDMDELIADTKNSLKGSFPEYEIVTQTTPYPLFYSDFSLLKIILENLIENALTFTSSAHVTIKLEVWKNESDIFISIEDNGDGIEKDIRSKVFDLFFRGSTKSRGNGLGLYLVKKAVEKLGGNIELITSEGKFTRVNLKLHAVIPTSKDQFGLRMNQWQ